MEFDEFSQKVIGAPSKCIAISDPAYLNRHAVSAWHANSHMPGFRSRWKCRSVTKSSYSIVGYRIDLLVSGDLIVEIKCVETLLPIHQAQILTYMRLAKIPIGLLINFNVTRLQTGIKRFVL